MFHWRLSLNIVLLLLLVNFVSGFRLELMYISLIISMRSNLIDPDSFQQLVHRNHFFHLYQQNKSKSKVKFRQVSNHCKRGLETATLAYATKTKGFKHIPGDSGICLTVLSSTCSYRSRNNFTSIA